MTFHEWMDENHAFIVECVSKGDIGRVLEMFDSCWAIAECLWCEPFHLHGDGCPSEWSVEQENEKLKKLALNLQVSWPELGASIGAEEFAAWIHAADELFKASAKPELPVEPEIPVDLEKLFKEL